MKELVRRWFESHRRLFLLAPLLLQLGPGIVETWRSKMLLTEAEGVMHRRARKYSLRGSSPRLMAHKTIALTAELRELSIYGRVLAPHQQGAKTQVNARTVEYLPRAQNNSLPCSSGER